jgi:hypothetical protein
VQRQRTLHQRADEGGGGGGGSGGGGGGGVRQAKSEKEKLKRKENRTEGHYCQQWEEDEEEWVCACAGWGLCDCLRERALAFYLAALSLLDTRLDTQVC